MKRTFFIFTLFILLFSFNVFGQDKTEELEKIEYIRPIKLELLETSYYKDENNQNAPIFIILDENNQKKILKLNRVEFVGQWDNNKIENSYIVFYIEKYMLCFALDSSYLILGANNFDWNKTFERTQPIMREKTKYKELVQVFKIIK